MAMRMRRRDENRIPGHTYREWEEDGLEQIYRRGQEYREHNRPFYTLERNNMQPRWAIYARTPTVTDNRPPNYPPILAGPFDSEEEALRAYRTFMALTLSSSEEVA